MKMKRIFNLLIATCCLGFISSAQSTELDTYGGLTDIKGVATGFFHTQKIDGRWWLVTPEGHGFWGIGMAHPITDFCQSAVTFTYNGDQEAWIRGSIQRMRDLGFNCVWSGPYCPERLMKGFVDKELAEKVFSEANMPYAFPIPLIKHDVELQPGEKRPDVFSDEYRQYVEALVAKHVPKLKDNPWVMGYYYGFGSWDREILWINETIERKKSAGRARLLGILEKRYEGNIERFNGVYGTTYRSFSELNESGTLAYPSWIRKFKNGYGSMPKQVGAQDQYDDAQALLGAIIEEVYRLGYETIHKCDPNHMILGSYVKQATLTTEIWHAVDPYIDVIAPQILSEVFPIKPVAKALDKPVLISDQSFGNVYPVNIQGTSNAWGAIPDHIDRLVLYDILAERISIDPDFIGVQFCACLVDQSHPDKAYERGQPGFFSIDGECRHHLCRTVHSLNDEMLDNAEASPNDQKGNVLEKKYHEIILRYRGVMRDRKALLQDHPAIVYP